MGFKDYQSIAELIHSLTQIDVVIFQTDGTPAVRVQENTLPAFQRLSELREILARTRRLQTNDFLTFIDSAQLTYLAVVLPSFSIGGTVILGPFLTTILSTNEINHIMVTNNSTVSERTQLTQLYQSLPVLAENQVTDLASLTINLFAKPLTPINSKVKLSHRQFHEKSFTTVNAEHRQQIEANYVNEDKITNAIASGDENKVHELNATVTKIFDSFSNRIPGNPLRSAKNICFVFNTVCRIAAHKGGVHPFYLNDISEKYALLIERQSTLQGLHQLVTDMTHEYCQLVISVSTAGYSPMIKQTADYILLNLGYPIALSQIAESIGTNPSYLSRKFKQETGMTITDYINFRRISVAKQYLVTPKLAITDIALMSGFNDLNYFIRVFKKVVGETPSQFRRKTTGSAIEK